MASRGAWVVLVVVGLAACRPVPPPPLTPMHAETEAAPRDSVTAMLVVGVVKAGNLLFSDATGLGVALRVEHQQTDRTALGLQLGGGRGSDGTGRDGRTLHHTLIAVEGYGRTSLADWTAATYGAGLSWLSTGLITLSGHAGAAVSFPNESAVPYLAAGIAGVLPVVPGAPFGQVANPVGGPCLACERSPNPAPLTNTGPPPTRELFLLVDLGVVVPIADGNRLSLDLGFAHARDQTIGAFSVADGLRHRPSTSTGAKDP